MIRRRLSWIVVAAAAALLVLPLDPALVERWYSGRVYLQWQPLVTVVSNRSDGAQGSPGQVPGQVPDRGMSPTRYAETGS